MNPVAENTIAKFSVALLIMMGTGLVFGTTYIVTLSNASDRVREEVQTAKKAIADLQEFNTAQAKDFEARRIARAKLDTEILMRLETIQERVVELSKDLPRFKNDD